ncbi:hypothetical protein PIB30_050869 [Stylosanthes scabra]|uniref:Uncharacterized protein n=1 Tax=Stylosanthes scabra TaxID=79078 RepID=A0ABU6SHZ3_9FABA|nr:hypothetical protein [Stylosanthes scabra]
MGKAGGGQNRNDGKRKRRRRRELNRRGEEAAATSTSRCRKEGDLATSKDPDVGGDEEHIASGGEKKSAVGERVEDMSGEEIMVGGCLEEIRGYNWKKKRNVDKFDKKL